MFSRVHTLLVGSLCLLLCGCDTFNIFMLIPEYDNCGTCTREFTYVTTGEPVVDATVVWAPADAVDLDGRSEDDYLDEFGVPIGSTDELGRIAFPWCERVDPIDFVNADVEPAYEMYLLRVNTDGHVRTFVFRTLGATRVSTAMVTVDGVQAEKIYCHEIGSTFEQVLRELDTSDH